MPRAVAVRMRYEKTVSTPACKAAPSAQHSNESNAIGTLTSPEDCHGTDLAKHLTNGMTIHADRITALLTVKTSLAIRPC